MRYNILNQFGARCNCLYGQGRFKQYCDGGMMFETTDINVAFAYKEALSKDFLNAAFSVVEVKEQ